MRPEWNHCLLPWQINKILITGTRCPLMPQDAAFCAVSCGSVLSRAFQNEIHHSAIAGKHPMTACGGTLIGCLLNRNKRAARWVRSARKTLQWRVFSEERAEALDQSRRLRLRVMRQIEAAKSSRKVVKRGFSTTPNLCPKDTISRAFRAIKNPATVAAGVKFAVHLSCPKHLLVYHYCRS